MPLVMRYVATTTMIVTKTADRNFTATVLSCGRSKSIADFIASFQLRAATKPKALIIRVVNVSLNFLFISFRRFASFITLFIFFFVLSLFFSLHFRHLAMLALA